MSSTTATTTYPALGLIAAAAGPGITVHVTESDWPDLVCTVIWLHVDHGEWVDDRAECPLDQLPDLVAHARRWAYPEHITVDVEIPAVTP